MRHMALELLYVLPNCETVQNFVCVCGDVTQMAWTLQDVVPKTTKTMTATTSYLRSAAHLLLSHKQDIAGWWLPRGIWLLVSVGEGEELAGEARRPPAPN